jgi:hypothetical protein
VRHSGRVQRSDDAPEKPAGLAHGSRNRSVGHKRWTTSRP